MAVQCQIINPENIHTSNIVQTEQVIFRNTGFLKPDWRKGRNFKRTQKKKKGLGIRNLRNSMKFSKDEEKPGDSVTKSKVMPPAGAQPPAV